MTHVNSRGRAGEDPESGLIENGTLTKILRSTKEKQQGYRRRTGLKFKN